MLYTYSNWSIEVSDSIISGILQWRIGGGGQQAPPPPKIGLAVIFYNPILYQNA